MEWKEIIFYTLLLFGSLIGIGVGLYAAFAIARHRLDREENTDIDIKEHHKKQKKEKAKKLAKRKQGRREQNATVTEKSEPASEENGQNGSRGRMAEVVSERQNLESLMEFNCDIDGSDRQETIEKARQKSNEAYEYLEQFGGKNNE